MTLLRWLSFLLGSQTVILLLDLSLSSDTSIFFYNGFPSIGKFWSCRLSFHWLSIKFKTGCPVSLHSLWLFLCWLGWSCDHLRDVPWKDIFKLDASAAASEFCEWVQVGLDAYIPHRKYQVKPDSSPWFSAACAAAIVHRNHFFCLYQKDKSSDSKVKFRQASNCCKSVFFISGPCI